MNFTYDKVGNLKTYDDATTTGSYDYDLNYRKTSETVDYGTFQLTNGYTYYKNGLKKTFTGPDSNTYEYDYDANNQLASVQIPNFGFITVNEYNWNRPAAMTLPGGSTREFTYDPLMRVESIIAKDPPQNSILDYQYTYDKMDNIVGKSTEHGQYDYDYDDLYRLTTVDNPEIDDEGFTYDPVGNRLTSLDVVGDWGYNQNNELGSYDGVSFSYDENGNTIQKNDNGTITDYVYNIENRLVEVTTNDPQPTTSSYYYDPFGRRLWKDVGGTKTHLLYADEGLVGEYDGTGAEIKTYGYRPGSTWTTDPLFMKEGSEYYFYHNDHLGTPQKMTGISGNVVWSAKYSSFGEATVEVETVENNLRFPGQYLDNETGLHYNWHRDYHPGVGRYIEGDPILQPFVGRISAYGLDNEANFLVPKFITNPKALHKYIHVLNNPINFLDQTGLLCGSGSTEDIVPDFPGGFDFTGPCQNHDDCYGCKGKELGKSKSDCDKGFLRDMKCVCWRGRNVTRWGSCMTLAHIYYNAVKYLAQDEFNAARKKECDCEGEGQ